MIEQFPLLPGVMLRCCRDTRFKHGCLTLQFVRPMDAAETALNALIPTVLLRGTRMHPDLRSIVAVLDDLYGASVSPLIRRIGDIQAFGFSISFMDERYAMPGDRVLEPLTAFLRELLFDTLLENGGFRTDYVETEKKNVISAIEAELNDKQAYAINALLRRMCRFDSFGIPRVGEPKQIAAIDPVTLYAHYQKILRESPVELFYVGSTPGSEIASLLRPLFAGLERSPLPRPQNKPFCSAPGSDDTEVMDVSQGKLCMGFTTDITTYSEHFAAMQVLNMILGGGMTSKLFMQVREKQSLCYSIGTNYFPVKGLLIASAGIDFEQEERTRTEVLHQLALCQQGEITQEELDAAKEAIFFSLESIQDAPEAIENYNISAILNGVERTTAEYAAQIAAVDLAQAAAAARTLRLHSTYFLKGEQPDA